MSRFCISIDRVSPCQHTSLIDNRIILIGGRDDAENEKSIEVWTSLDRRQFRVELMDLSHLEWINYPNSFAIGKLDFDTVQ